MKKREARKEDLNALLELYSHYNAEPESADEINSHVISVWEEILTDKNHRVLFIEVDSGAGLKPVSTCVLLLVPNLTHDTRPYAIVENVITHRDYRKKGYGKAVLDYAKEIAESHNCYKIMLATGRKDEATLRFYENAGYNRNDKTAFIQWL
ncbi:MAG: GNAT family N-acetyltransferase [Oscillospiraceae bacterium]|nr:GNAT family N-acetyltransferase [Oscillospiraceae bacterium]